MPWCGFSILCGQCVIKCKQEPLLVDLSDKQLAFLPATVRGCDPAAPMWPTGGGSLVAATFSARNKMFCEPAGIDEKEMNAFLTDINGAGAAASNACCCCLSVIVGCFCGYAAASLSEFIEGAKKVVVTHNKRLEDRGCAARWGFGAVKLLDSTPCCMPHIWVVTIRYPEGVLPPPMFGLQYVNMYGGGRRGRHGHHQQMMMTTPAGYPAGYPVADGGYPVVAGGYPIAGATPVAGGTFVAATGAASPASPPSAPTDTTTTTTSPVAVEGSGFCPKCGSARSGDSGDAFCAKCGNKF